MMVVKIVFTTGNLINTIPLKAPVRELLRDFTIESFSVAFLLFQSKRRNQYIFHRFRLTSNGLYNLFVLSSCVVDKELTCKGF